ncbi:DUF6475 domain-containing protein [Ferrovum myxofaciens]|uniref:DUF6475 domain-containing protein n=1 Tax=Ferrovum myxofaciens TaxID=416213 RepID=UPI003EBC2BC5
MKPSDFDNFSTMMLLLAEYYGVTMPKGKLGIYWEGLQDLDLLAVRQALSAHVQNPDNGQFLPRVADIRKMLGGTTQDAALVAWSKVDGAMRCVGPYQSVVFEDALIHRVLADMGGWIHLSKFDENEWPFKAKEFETRYRGFAVRGDRPEYPPVMIGLAENENKSDGRPSPEPVLIGDRGKCLAVMANGSSKPTLQISGLFQGERFLVDQRSAGSSEKGV